jgi:hypothetical protein
VDRVIAIAGMGMPGRFGEPELTVLVRELCWSLGRLGKRHLATVLIGAGNGNMPIETAVSGWMRGVRQAFGACRDADGRGRVRQITFVERDARRLRRIRDAILECRAGDAGRLTIEYEGPGENEIVTLEREGARRAMEEWLTRQSSGTRFDASADAATRITVSLDRETYRFGAITADAAIPEREIPLDPSLVMTANDEMAAEHDLERQREHGRFLGRLLVPAELQPQLASTAPIVMMLDATTARVHWEMVAYTAGPAGVSEQGSEFLGLARGFTRQLRTTFAPPPEPPPPPQRVLRVLIVADPAADAHLPGAEEEAVEVAELLESFNTVYGATTESRIEVVRLFGPTEATRTRVMRELVLRRYDVLHFAGHCLYDKDHPSASGWLFTGGELLRARELQRIDRIPKFVFSNACESGVTPQRTERRSAGMAPSFAEAFFARGVANFVCTAWPIDDTAARVFAAALYGSLVGVRPSGPDGTRYERGRACQMWEAMQRARRAIAEQSYGGGTWGAYQHYGNPYFQLFDQATLDRQAPRPAATPAGFTYPTTAAESPAVSGQ